jgi:hypothetical protein
LSRHEGGLLFIWYEGEIKEVLGLEGGIKTKRQVVWPSSYYFSLMTKQNGVVLVKTHYFI